MKDLIALVADKQMEFTLRGLLERTRALQIRKIHYSIYRHPNSDPGCRAEAHHFLRQFHLDYTHSLVIFDWEGCGENTLSQAELTRSIEQRLANNGWGDRARCIILDPELEVWVWSDSPEVGKCIGWKKQNVQVQDWLKSQGYWHQSKPKPDSPKEALEIVLREAGVPRSAALYREIATHVSLRRCTDPSFEKFRATIQEWFN